MIELSYQKNGDYLIPDLKLPEQNLQPLGKYGRMRERYLKEHRKGLYSCLLLSGKLPQHLQEIDETAKQRMDNLIQQLAENIGVTERFKEEDPMAWTQIMNNLKAQAEEIVFHELIYG